MALTVNNINTLSLLNILNRTSTAQSDVLTRLSTGQRINRGADDPAGLTVLRGLDSELTAVSAGIASNQRTDAILGVADKSLSEVSNLLGQIQKLADETANTSGLSASEISANQSQVDDAITSIDRIIRSTQFNGRRLLDGSFGVNISAPAVSAITDVRVYSKGQTSATLTVNVTSAAQRGTMQLAATSAGSAASISIQGKLGTAVIDIQSGETFANVLTKINDAKNQTGVSAYTSSNHLYLTSTEFGSSAFVRVSTLQGSATSYTAANDYGADAKVTVNGQKAAVDGTSVSFTSNGVSVSFELTAGYNTAGGSKQFKLLDGGATFQLGTDSTTRATIGVDGLYTDQLGNKTLGYLSSLKGGGTNSLISDPAQAAKIARAAAQQLASVQGRIGGFQKFQVRTSLNSLNDTREGLEKARSVISDVDYATETADLNRQNVLLQSAISLLGLANQQSSQVLSLLR